uniref:Uncharacterized protein n=1 Tax=Glossina austeni TaxID=7395 RepID=A0A1A9UZR9_GLOAU
MFKKSCGYMDHYGTMLKWVRKDIKDMSVKISTELIKSSDAEVDIQTPISQHCFAYSSTLKDLNDSGIDSRRLSIRDSRHFMIIEKSQGCVLKRKALGWAKK